MQKKIKKIIGLLLTVTFLIISMVTVIAAEDINLSVRNVYLIANGDADGNTYKSSWKLLATMPTTFTSSPTNTSCYMWLVADLRDRPVSGKVIVWTFDLRNTAYSEPVRSRVAFTDSTFVNSSKSPKELNALDYDQYVLATTATQMNSDTVRYTVTVELINPSSNFICWNIGKMGLNVTSNANRTMSQIRIYETVDEAANSGATPEEMREVLSQWGEEELLPGIQDSVQSGVQSGMEAALEDEKQQASTDGNSAVDELTGALSGVLDDIDQAKEAFNTLGSALQYSGTSASLTFPGMNVPFLGQISEPINFDMTGYIDSTFPPQLLLLIRCALSIGIVSYPIFELVRQLRKLLDKG